MKYMHICLSLLIGFFVGDASSEECLFGVAAMNGGAGNVLRFANTTARADQKLSSLIATGMTALNSSEACAANVCGSNAGCSINTTNTYVCECDALYEPTCDALTFSCGDIDECTKGTHNCSNPGGACTNADPGFSCSCEAGFTGDGYNCTDISECASNPCATNATCSEPAVNTHTCVCDSGFTGDGNTTCSNIDECVNGTNSCDTNADCVDTIGSHTCTCRSGYTGNGTTCENIDDCASNPCHTDADCTDGLNNYTCACGTGFSGDGTFCERTRTELNVTFYITCTNLSFSGDLNSTGTSLYMNVTSAITTAIKSFVSGVDAPASVSDVSFSFDTSNDGLGSAQTPVTILVNNTNIVLGDYLKVVNSNLKEYVECGIQASSDECNLGIDNCGGKTCVDTLFDFCCYTDHTFRAEVKYNTTFTAKMNNLTSSEAIQVFNDATARGVSAVGALQKRGCTYNVTTEEEFLGNGSTIAVFTMKIINATFTPENLDAEMQKAENQTTSFGTVIGAGDFDECSKAYEANRNCHAFATCSNFIGSFSCECNSTHYDNGTNASGEICIVPVTVSCSGSSMNISILTAYYDTKNVSLTSLHLADHSCNFSTHSYPVGNSTQFELSINDCNTTLTTDTNTSSILASNYISNVPATGVFTGFEIRVPFQCLLPSSLNITVGLNGTEKIIELPQVVTDGAFNLIFELFDSSFTTPKDIATSTFRSDEIIYGQIKVLNQINNIGVFFSECWGTPTNNRDDSDKVIFISNGCPVSNTVQAISVISNGDGPARMSFQMFYFTQVNAVYLHCDVSVCQPSCTQTCAKRRRKRSEPTTKSDGATITVQLRLDPNDANFNNTLVEIGGLGPYTPNSNSSINDITLPIVAAILAFLLILILVIVVVVVFRTQRAKKNDYDLTHVNMHAITVKPPSYEQ